MRRGQHLDRRALCVWLEPIQLVLDRELGRQTSRQRVRRVGHHHIEVSQAIVAARTATDEHAGCIPASRASYQSPGCSPMKPLPFSMCSRNGLLRGGVGEAFVIADDQHVHACNHVRESAQMSV
jgi:hypothetical protein